MKTILSLTTLATVTALSGLLPWAFGESKDSGKRSAMLPVKAALTETEASKSGATDSNKIASKSKSTTAAKASTKNSSRKTSSPVGSAERKSTSQSAKVSESAKPCSKKSPAETAKLSLTETQENKLLTLLNEGTVEDLDAIPGIASTRADSIVSARPYGSVHEIILVDGVGNATFEKILAYGKSLTQRSVSPVTGTRKS